MRWIFLAIVGLGIGLLTGLSVSPVLSIVLTSLVGAAATLTAIFGNYGDRKSASSSESPKRYIDPQPGPLALLVATIVLGALIGLASRVNIATIQQASKMGGFDLAPPTTISESIQAWTDLGLDKTKVTQNLFEAYLGIAKGYVEKTTGQAATAETVGLFAVSADECARFRTLSDRKLRAEMQAGESPTIARIAEKVTDVEILRLVAEVACGQEAK